MSKINPLVYNATSNNYKKGGRKEECRLAKNPYFNKETERLAKKSDKIKPYDDKNNTKSVALNNKTPAEREEMVFDQVARTLYAKTTPGFTISSAALENINKTKEPKNINNPELVKGAVDKIFDLPLQGKTMKLQQEVPKREKQKKIKIKKEMPKYKEIHKDNKMPAERSKHIKGL